MIILHAGFTDGRLYLWGEVPPEERRRPRNKPDQTVQGSAPQPYPYAADATVLRKACTIVEGVHPAAHRHPADALIYIPTLDGAPVPSSPLIADAPESQARPILRPFTISAVELLPEEAIALLSPTIEHGLLAPGVIAGSTVTFWMKAFRLAVALVVRQQFLPGLLYDGEQYQACWDPILVGTMTGRASRLARHMPEACRALTVAGSAPPNTASRTLLAEFLAMAVDTLVLQTVSHTASLPRAQRPPGRPRLPLGASLSSPDERWLRALHSESGRISGTEAEMEELAARIAAWKRPLLTSAAAPFRLCFRLEEPPEISSTHHSNQDGAWSVRYLLQSTEDPSLLIDVADIWTVENGRRKLPESLGANPREYLLAALGRASRLVPEIEASLRTPAPNGYGIDATGAYRFLQEDAWLLEQAGFGVLLPAWWSRRGSRQRLTARATVQSPKLTAHAGLTLDSIARVDWDIALGDQRLSLADLQQLSGLKAPLLRMRGEWMELNPEEIETALAYWKKKKDPHTQVPIRDVVRMALGAIPAPGGMELGAVEATGIVQEMLAQLNGTRPPLTLPPPSGFHGTLRPYQERGYAWLAFLRSLGFGACLADDMGLGKTIQTLALLQQDWERGTTGPALLVCPTSVMGNWRKEAERFTPELPVMMHHGIARKKDATFAREAKRSALVVTSYPLLHRDAALLATVPWSGIILDEAQNIKNPDTRQARAARALKAGYRIALTGTPVENHVGDLWSIMEFLNPGFLGSHAAFKRAFFLPIQVDHDPDATERLKKLTGPFILRRLKTDRSIITDLPQKQEMKVFCTLTREQASLYKAVVDEMTGELDDAEGIQRKGMVLAGLSKLKQVCNHPAQFLGDNSAIAGRSGKLDRLTEMLEEAIAAGDRALVFTQFAEMGTIIKRHLQETFAVEALFLHGATPIQQRNRMVERFQADADAPPIFILSLKAGGSGLNLTAAAHVFHFDRWWNPAVENQATDRAFRIGQQRNVQVHKFVCAGTVEEKIDEMIERKQEIASNIVGSGEGWLTQLSTTELKQILALRMDALGE